MAQKGWAQLRLNKLMPLVSLISLYCPPRLTPLCSFRTAEPLWAKTPEPDIWTNFTPYLWCGQNTHNRPEPAAAWPGGGGPIVAFLWTGMNTDNGPVCMYACVCVWRHSLMPSQYTIVLWTSTVIYVKILSLPSSLFSNAFVVLVSFSPRWILLVPFPLLHYSNVTGLSFPLVF